MHKKIIQLRVEVDYISKFKELAQSNKRTLSSQFCVLLDDHFSKDIIEPTEPVVAVVAEKPKRKTRSKPKTPAEQSEYQEVKRLYFEGYLKRYGREPKFVGKQNKGVYSLISELGFEDACIVAANYCDCPVPYFFDRHYDFMLLISDYDKVLNWINDPEVLYQGDKARSLAREVGKVAAKTDPEFVKISEAAKVRAESHASKVRMETRQKVSKEIQDNARLLEEKEQYRLMLEDEEMRKTQ